MDSRLWVLPPDDSAAASARRCIHGVLAGRAECDDAVLIASELAANAIVHGRPPITLRLDTSDAIAITVTGKAGATDPVVVDPALDEPRGRGLLLVSQIAADWGWRREAGLMSVWARLP
jgi:anti-sigma regulatory factor (Ser/Thr protein kinase)